MSGNSRYFVLFVFALLPLTACAALPPDVVISTESLRGAKVVRLEKKIRSEASSPQEQSACTRFSLNASQATDFFKRSTVISGEDLTVAYYSLPCDYIGDVIVGGRQYRFSINAGATGRIWVGSAVVMLGCGGRCNDLMNFGFYSEAEDENINN